jgi:hypothetical protein
MFEVEQDIVDFLLEDGLGVVIFILCKLYHDDSPWVVGLCKRNNPARQSRRVSVSLKA